MSKQVLGKNIFFQIKVEGVFYSVFCAKSGSITSNQDETETTNINSGPAREYIPGMQDATADVNGLTTTDNSPGKIAVMYLLEAAQRRTIFDARWVMTNEDGEVIALTFRAFTRTVSIDRQMGMFSSSTASFRITGPITPSSDVPEPVEPVCEAQDPLYLTLAEGATSVTDPLLEADDVVILHVDREGLGHTETTGTPGNREFKFTGGTGNGTVEFDPANPGMPGGEGVYVLYKINNL